LAAAESHFREHARCRGTRMRNSGTRRLSTHPGCVALVRRCTCAYGKAGACPAGTIMNDMQRAELAPSHARAGTQPQNNAQPIEPLAGHRLTAIRDPWLAAVQRKRLCYSHHLPSHETRGTCPAPEKPYKIQPFDDSSVAISLHFGRALRRMRCHREYTQLGSIEPHDVPATAAIARRTEPT
jgi:hypothetical protein